MVAPLQDEKYGIIDYTLSGKKYGDIGMNFVFVLQ
jgi:hypothetical protein